MKLLLEFYGLINQFWWWFVFNTPHHVGFYMPIHHPRHFLEHERILWHQIRWFFNHEPSYNHFVRP